MSRKKTSAAAPVAAPTTAVPGTEAQTIIQDAAQTTATQSTLGDGDATGAAQEAPSATAAPQAPAPDVVTEPEDHSQKRGPEGYAVQVTGPAKGRWRIGRKFGPEPVSIPVQELTEDDLAKLEGDPELVVALVSIEA
jgi:hypothetical protein